MSNNIIKFLLGESDFNGLWFGERENDRPFWWRKHLREYAEAPAPSAWVSVEERLPEDCKIVIISGGLGYYSYIVKRWYTIVHTQMPALIEWEVEYWMPLPSPPEK